VQGCSKLPHYTAPWNYCEARVDDNAVYSAARHRLFIIVRNNGRTRCERKLFILWIFFFFKVRITAAAVLLLIKQYNVTWFTNVSSCRFYTIIIIIPFSAVLSRNHRTSWCPTFFWSKTCAFSTRKVVDV